MTDRPPPALRARALAWLARREHSRAELARKLLPVAQAEGCEHEVAPLLDWLQAQRYLSDERFVESRVNARASRLGLRRISAELRQHGVDLPPATRDALAATEAERARAVWSRRFGAPSTDPRERARQARFLLARGFDAETVRRLVAAGSPGDPGDSGDPGDEA
ncbi:MAG: recombination regulator RecX [Ideonella sp.]|nr:recombination regulator RecX [Ideonella sp.]